MSDDTPDFNLTRDQLLGELSAMKLRAEKAEKACDLMADEFKRIKALTADIVRHPFLATEIRGICDRGIGGIKQTVPLIEQRDNAEKERDALRAELTEAQETYDDLVRLLRKRFPQREDGSLPDFAVEDVLKENARLREALDGLVESCKGRIPADSSDSLQVEAIHVLCAQSALAGKGEK